MLTTNQIIAEAKALLPIGRDEAIYYVHGEVVIGRDGCQPTNSKCLCVGDVEMEESDWQDVEAELEYFLCHVRD